MQFEPWLAIGTFNSIFVVCLSRMTTSGGVSVKGSNLVGTHFLGHICRQKQTQPEAKGVEWMWSTIDRLNEVMSKGPTHTTRSSMWRKDQFRLPGSFPIAKGIHPSLGTTTKRRYLFPTLNDPFPRAIPMSLGIDPPTKKLTKAHLIGVPIVV